MSERLRLGVNIDHVATIRNARGGDHPDPVRAAEIVAAVGGDGITAHLREDRRHIRDDDLERIQKATDLPLNLEMAGTEEMLAIALAHKPHAACIVPEKREERTTEGGLDAAGLHNQLAPIVWKLADHGIRVSLFIEADERQLSGCVRQWSNSTPANMPMPASTATASAPRANSNGSPACRNSPAKWVSNPMPATVSPTRM